LGCSICTDQEGYLALRLVFDGLRSHEGSRLEDTPENRRKAEDRARVIDQEIEDGTFDYLHWFPDGNLASRFRRDAGAPVVCQKSGGLDREVSRGLGRGICEHFRPTISDEKAI
jgi:hypothetical protein